MGDVGEGGEPFVAYFERGVLKMLAQAPTRTAEEWQQFWVERGEQINTEVQRRMTAADES